MKRESVTDFLAVIHCIRLEVIADVVHDEISSKIAHIGTPAVPVQMLQFYIEGRRGVAYFSLR
jgi:hypothetical protein